MEGEERYMSRMESVINVEKEELKDVFIVNTTSVIAAYSMGRRLLALVVPQKIGMEEFEPNKNEDTVIKIIVKSEGLTDVSVVIMICVENVCMIML